MTTLEMLTKAYERLPSYSDMLATVALLAAIISTRISLAVRREQREAEVPVITVSEYPVGEGQWNVTVFAVNHFRAGWDFTSVEVLRPRGAKIGSLSALRRPPDHAPWQEGGVDPLDVAALGRKARMSLHVGAVGRAGFGEQARAQEDLLLVLPPTSNSTSTVLLRFSISASALMARRKRITTKRLINVAAQTTVA